MKESNHGLQLGGVESRDAGLELGLQVVLHDADVSYPDREHVLIQGMDQGKELIQVLVLEREESKAQRVEHLLVKQMQCRNRYRNRRMVSKPKKRRKRGEITKTDG